MKYEQVFSMNSNTIKAAEEVTTERYNYLAKTQKKVSYCNQHPVQRADPIIPSLPVSQTILKMLFKANFNEALQQGKQ